MENLTTTAADLQPAAPTAALTALETQIAGWKSQGFAPRSVSVEVTPEDTAVCYFKRPDRNIIAYALTLTFNKKVLEAGEFILKNCWLGGDERMNPNSAAADDTIVVAAAIEVAGTVDILSATVKKL